MFKQQYLAFEVGGRRYCAPLLQIREVKKIGAITIIPQSVPDMLGVINLRGEIVPLIDLQARMSRSNAKAATDRMNTASARIDAIADLIVDQAVRLK